MGSSPCLDQKTHANQCHPTAWQRVGKWNKAKPRHGAGELRLGISADDKFL